ncbi:testis expressed protein 56-like [Petaurus breviceps papuanus]|uniref:testis expressed protein 56-like n=1 Tax=Petaurus breviceps papuanus TaxID=3040969 RepID=UPI0036DDD396
MSIPEDVRGSLKLPPLTIYQKGKTFKETEDLRSTFDRLSKLHRLLPDPLRDLLCSFISEEDVRENNEFPKLEKILKVKKLPSEVYTATAPNHVAPWRRNISNAMFEEGRERSFWKKQFKGILMSAVIARWLDRNMKPSMKENLVTEELLVFGPIESVTTLGRQSALIIYEDIISACRAVSAFPANNEGRRLQCCWYHKFMAKYKTCKQLQKTPLLQL